MKYAMARIVYGSAGLLLILIGIAIMITPRTLDPHEWGREVVDSVRGRSAVATLPFALGLLCVMRRRQWHEAGRLTHGEKTKLGR